MSSTRRGTVAKKLASLSRSTATLGWLCLSVCGGLGVACGGAPAAAGGGGNGSSSGGFSDTDAGAGSSGGSGSTTPPPSGDDSGAAATPDSGGGGGGGNVAPDAGDSDAPTTGGGSGDDAGAPGGALNPNVAPGGNFDLSVWELQEPVGSPGSPTTFVSSQLAGPTGHQDTYFFTDSTDGSMTFWDPENGVTTPNSSYPRSELREMTASGAAANWLPPGTHTLSATVKASVIPDHVAVGQIHLGTGTPASTKPLLELFYYSSGEIEIGIEQTPAGGNEQLTKVGSVPLGTKWSYVIGLSGNTISLTINGGTVQTFPMSSTFDQEGMYFKAGDYDQTADSSAAPTVGAKVQFYALTIFHGP
jgi:hypothetical protein